MSQTAAAKHLGLSKQRFKALIASGQIVPYCIDPDTGRPLFTADQLSAHQRRAGEIAAERAAS